MARSSIDVHRNLCALNSDFKSQTTLNILKEILQPFRKILSAMVRPRRKELRGGIKAKLARGG